MKIKQIQRLTALVTLLLVFLVGLNSLVYSFRWDLTLSRAYSLSSATKEMTRELPEPLNITYYISSKLKDRVPVFTEIQDMILEYASVSKGKIIVEVINSDQLEISQKLAQKGLAPLQISENNVTEYSRSVAYSGIVLSYLGKESVLPAVTQRETLEYDLNRQIKELVYEENRKVGLLPLTPGLSIDNHLAILQQILGALYTVEAIVPETKIDESYKVVVAVGQNDSDYQHFVLDQYLLQGGSLLMLVDRHQTQISPYGFGGGPLEASLTAQWLQSRGILVEEQLLADTSCNAALMPTGQAFSIVQYPYFVKVMGVNGNTSHPVTAAFNGLNLLWASPLTFTEEVLANQNIQAISLAETTDKAWSAPLESGIDFEQAHQSLLMAEGQPQEKKMVSAALLGEFESYYKGKNPPSRQGEEEEFQSPLEKSQKIGRLLVVGDTDFAVIDQQNQMMVQIYNLFNVNLEQNMVFIQNAVEWLSADEQLLSLRTRIQRNTQLDQIQDPEIRRGYFIFVQVFLLVFVPLGIIILGGARIYIRKRRAQKGGIR